jgi:hypothetical protein
VILIVTKIFIKSYYHKTAIRQALATKQEAENQVRILQQEKATAFKHQL